MSVLVSGRSARLDDREWLLATEPRRERWGEAELLASTHSSSCGPSSVSSSPISKWTLEATWESRLLCAEMEEEREWARLDELLLFLPMLGLDRLRGRCVCDEFFFRFDEDGSRASFTSEVDRRCVFVGLRSGDGDVARRVNLLTDVVAWCLCNALEEGTLACSLPPVPPPTTCFWCFVR